ncbi:MAG: Beta-phosphoglucomutase [Brockia lithotrophica]|uniref:Beta-phosphoglucomutase n=1 Tax=Brockia lithotrophica TaxID=933949 RepID=A0A2T5GAB7_9BACL|nr:beta-phosphoglucomutase [Brockia lithotrophica]PTQ53088.1 MAG: Beta-phosphoglucomutase [Brockia lithotrophica]
MWAVVFDLDGVLVDTAKLHAEAWRRLAEELGISLSEEFLRSLRGLNRMDSLDRILEWGGRTEVGTAERERLAEQKNLWYVGSLEHLTPRDVLPGVVELLDGLASYGVPVAVASSSKNARLVLERTGLAKRFSVVVDGNAVLRAKPDPTIFLEAFRRLGVSPRNGVVVEDAASGVEAARRAGARVVGVGRSEELPGADLVVSDLRELTVDRLRALVDSAAF